ncbi:MAG: homoserine kinase, partial [Bacilli bacterium]
SLPKEYPLSAIKNNVSHIALLPLALKNGDLDLLRKTLIDKIHVPYRKTLINDYEIVENIMNKYNIPFTISGSGSTMIAFYLKGMEKEIDKLKSDLNKENFPSKVTLIDVSPSKKGVSIKKEILKNE